MRGNQLVIDEHDRKHPYPAESPSAPSRLRQLLVDVQNLVRRIGAILLERRLERGRNTGRATVTPNIADPLHRHIEDLAAEAGASRREDSAASDPATPNESERARPTEGAARKGRLATEPGTAPTGIFSALSARLRGLRTHTGTTPHVVDRLKASAHQHVVSALRLARQGSADEAKLHASLAEEAMQEAARYMDQSEYGAFERELKEKLSDIVTAR